jgi:hypothetical protein
VLPQSVTSEAEGTVDVSDRDDEARELGRVSFL